MSTIVKLKRTLTRLILTLPSRKSNFNGNDGLQRWHPPSSLLKQGWKTKGYGKILNAKKLRGGAGDL
eukprot:875682-Ditylum_brightwellii.AAC.1